jgi:DNA (cytosine-5)-methyltransferase 3A
VLSRPHAIKVTQLNFPNTKQIGDLNDFNISLLEGNNIDLLLCGSPCKNMSLINMTEKTGIHGRKSSLFFNCVDIMREVKPKYFLFENVASMTNKDKEIITKELDIEPILINSALVSAQERRRYYWTNIPNITQPIDKNIKLSDIIDYNAEPEETWSKKKICVCA